MGVRDQQIEKDYVLSWILYGIACHTQFSRAIVFKGGTVLKKVYFQDYRFSEDLDFTLLNREIFNNQIFIWWREVFDFIKEENNLQKMKSPSYVLLDTELPKTGKRNSRWSIQENLKTDTIQSALFT